MQERRHLLLRRAGFRCVLPAIPPKAAATSIASIPGRICTSRLPKNSSRASIQTARQHTPTTMAAGSFCPAACCAVSQAPGRTPRKLITTAAAESCCWPITPPSVSPAPSADSASSAALEAAIGISGTDLRKLVNRMRRKGVPIGSDRCGYFYAATAGEVYSTIQQLQNMENGLAAARRGLERSLDAFPLKEGAS